jgi:hypothetical protein
MNYKKVYESIIQRRLENPLSEGEYGERHHIFPRSLGGDDDETNLIRLTAREHFICHALLAEMYEEGTNEWYKMNHAFMMMKAESEDHGGHRYINSRLYELKRKDFSKVMSYVQSGSKNSQHGKVWICNLVLERSIKVDKTELDFYLENGWNNGRVIDFDVFKRRRLDIENEKKVRSNEFRLKKQRYFKSKETYYNKLYDDFISSDCKSLREFHRKLKMKTVVGTLSKNFTKYVDRYTPEPRKSYKK